MIDPNQHLQIGSLLFEGLDQIDLTGPFEVLSRMPNSTYRIYAKNTDQIKDIVGLRLMAGGDLASAPKLDVLHVPGGPGQEALMEDEAVLDWVRTQAAGALCVFSVCTGALICGAAGLLKGKRATTHWTAMHMLHHFGAIPVDQRVVEDGDLLCAAGVTAGIDGALRLAARLRGDDVAQGIQLYMAYQPEPPFDAGSPERAPAAVTARMRAGAANLTARREITAQRIGARLGLTASAA